MSLRHITLFSHAGGSTTLQYVNYIPWVPRTKWECSFTIHTFRLYLKIWVELVFFQKIFIGNIVHPNIVFGITINKYNILKNINTIHNIFPIQIAINFFLFEEETSNVV